MGPNIEEILARVGGDLIVVGPPQRAQRALGGRDPLRQQRVGGLSAESVVALPVRDGGSTLFVVRHPYPGLEDLTGGAFPPKEGLLVDSRCRTTL